MIALKDRIVTASGRAADYDAHATVQQRSATRLARRIAALPLCPAPRILEFGCGTGLLAAAAEPLLPGAKWLMTDIAPGMVARSRLRFAGSGHHRFAVMDAEQPELPGKEQDFDLVCSNLTAQWFEDLAASADRLFALVRPGGWLAFSTLAAGTLAEWEEAHRGLGLRSGLRPLPELSALEELRPLGRAGTVTCERMIEQHADARGFLRSLRAIGAGTPRPGHRPLDVRSLRAAMSRFEQAGAAATYFVATCCFRRPSVEARS